MDPLTAVGLAAAIDDLSALVANVVSNLYKYWGAVQDAPRRSLELRTEIGSLLGLLTNVKDSLTNSVTPTESFLDAVLTTVDQLQEVLKEMERQTDVNRVQGLRACIWPFTNNEIDRFIKKIERYKATLSLALNIEQTYLSLVLFKRSLIHDRNVNVGIAEGLKDIKLDTSEAIQYFKGAA